MSPETSQPPVDAADLEGFRAEMEDDELVAELIETFLEEGPGRISSIRDADASGDVRQVSALTHALKGSAGTFGAHPLVDRCAQLEHLPAERPAAERSQLVGAVDSEYRRVATYLSSYLQSLR